MSCQITETVTCTRGFNVKSCLEAGAPRSATEEAILNRQVSSSGWRISSTILCHAFRPSAPKLGSYKSNPRLLEPMDESGRKCGSMNEGLEADPRVDFVLVLRCISALWPGREFALR
jgi:hypothetical protein